MNALDLHLRPALAPHARLQMDAVTGEPVLLYPEGVLMLNTTAHAILARVDGTAAIGEIIDALAAEYETPVEQLRADVFDCLSDLRERRLVVFPDGAPAP